MHWIDWLMVAIPLVGLVGLAVYTQRFVHGVADYISAGRCAGRYLLTSASGEAGSGVTNSVANIEKFMIAGFVAFFWDGLITPIILLLSIIGFVTYRYRQTRVLTLAQFFEERYSRAFRIFVGWILFLSGGIGYLVFPLASCLFFKAFIGLPDYFSILGLTVPTNAAIMGGYLSIAVLMISFGGQITLMVTDCVEGLFSHLAYLIIIVVIFSIISWGQVVDVLTGNVAVAGANAVAQATMAVQPDHSLVDPFDAFSVKDFNFYATLLGVFGVIYIWGAGQSGHGFRSAARTPHEGRMAGILGAWRTISKVLILMVVAIGALTYLRHPDFAERTDPVKAEIAATPSPSGKAVPAMSDKNPVASQVWLEGKAKTLATADGKEVRTEEVQRQRQQAPFVALRDMLPVGVKGLLLVIMIMGLFAGDGNHLISWSSIFIQDCVLPLRRKPFTTRQHLILLRSAAAGLALLGFIGGMLLPLTVPIFIWWAVTGAIYNGGAGAILIGGLYWRRGTVQGAWAAMITGSVLGLSSVVLSNNWFHSMEWLVGLGYPASWKSGFVLSAIVSWIAILVYVSVSLATCRKPFDLDRLLRRSAEHQEVDAPGAATVVQHRPLLHRLIGIDQDFTRTDRFIAISIFCYGLMMSGLVIFMLFWRYGLTWVLGLLGLENSALAYAMDKRAWTNVWLVVGIMLPATISIVTMLWFSVGSWIDLKRFFIDIRAKKREESDNGMVRRDGR
jgi:SSS family solute:Na+ symporter